MSNAQKPTIVLVTGAWQLPALYSPLTSGLESAGYIVKVPTLPSIGGKHASFDEDVAAVREELDTAVQTGDVVLLMHSYGGIPGTEAAKGFSKADRNNGGIVHLIYLSAFALAEGVSAFDAIGRQPLPWWQDIDNTQFRPINPRDILLNDVEETRANDFAAKFKDHAQGVFKSKITYAAWKHIDSTYIICEKDHAVVPQVQEYLATQPGNRITIDRIDAGHIPYLAKTDETVWAVRKAIGEQL